MVGCGIAAGFPAFGIFLHGCERLDASTKTGRFRDNQLDKSEQKRQKSAGVGQIASVDEVVRP